MGAFIDITNERYGNLVAVSATNLRDKAGGVVWLFKCSCGNIKYVSANPVRQGRVRSCGCLLKSHGMTDSRLFNIWVDMRQRCNNPKHPQYHVWGGKGVSVCKEWDSNFRAFYEWAMLNGYNDDLSIDRINNDGNYEPSNCRWATPRDQARNLSTNHKITIGGVTKILCEWIEESPISTATYHRRKRAGMSDEAALFTPPHRGLRTSQ